MENKYYNHRHFERGNTRYHVYNKEGEPENILYGFKNTGNLILNEDDKARIINEYSTKTFRIIDVKNM